MATDVYVEKITFATVTNGVVCIACGVSDDDKATLRLRIPLPLFQEFAGNVRGVLMKAMEDGWYGEDGRKAVENIRSMK